MVKKFFLTDCPETRSKDRPFTCAWVYDGRGVSVDWSAIELIRADAYSTTSRPDMSGTPQKRDHRRRDSYERMLDAVGKSIVAWDLDGRITYANRAAAQLFGWSSDASAGLRIHDLLSPLRPVDDDAPAFAEITRRGEAWAGDVRFLGRDGAPFVAAVAQRPLLDDSDQPSGAVAVIRDISKRLAAENALRTRDQQLRTLMAHAPVIIWTVDKAGLITYCEGNGLQKMGLSGGDFVGRSVFTLSDYAPFVGEHHQRALAGETFSITSDVGGRTFEVHYRPLRRPRGAITGAMALAIDVTRRTVPVAAPGDEADLGRDLLERQLRAATSAVSAARDQLANAAHELRTPLSVIRGYLSTITEYHERLSAEEMVDLVTRSLTAVAQLEKLVTDLLHLSKLDAGAIPRAARSMSPHQLVVDTVGQMRMAHAGREFVFRSKARDARVRGDRDQLREVIANLLDNAVKYSPDATPIEIDMAASAAGTASITVRDHGPGVPAADLDRIFSRFHRVRTAGNATVNGAGIGLAVCRALVESHGGHIKATLPEGGGLAVSFTLPLSRRRPKRG